MARTKHFRIDYGDTVACLRFGGSWNGHVTRARPNVTCERCKATVDFQYLTVREVGRLIEQAVEQACPELEGYRCIKNEWGPFVDPHRRDHARRFHYESCVEWLQDPVHLNRLIRRALERYTKLRRDELRTVQRRLVALDKALERFG